MQNSQTYFWKNLGDEEEILEVHLYNSKQFENEILNNYSDSFNVPKRFSRTAAREKIWRQSFTTFLFSLKAFDRILAEVFSSVANKGENEKTAENFKSRYRTGFPRT